jgi:hypothetical protein
MFWLDSIIFFLFSGLIFGSAFELNTSFYSKYAKTHTKIKNREVSNETKREIQTK